MYRWSRFVIALVIGAAPVFSSYAHHAVIGEYGDTSDPPEHTLRGEVTEVRWVDPHVRIRIEVLEGEHTGETWDINGHAPGLMARTYGFLPGGIKAGDTITALGWISNFDVPRMIPRALSINDGPMQSVLQAADRRDLRDGTLGEIIVAPSVTATQKTGGR